MTSTDAVKAGDDVANEIPTRLRHQPVCLWTHAGTEPQFELANWVNSTRDSWRGLRQLNPGIHSHRSLEAADTLATRLRDHINKENEILGPMVSTLIRDPSTWKGMRDTARAFGPCCVGCGCNGNV